MKSASTLLAQRTLIAETLAKHYAEIGSVVDQAAPRFSVARHLLAVFEGRSTDGSYEDEVVQAAALAAGVDYSPYRSYLPWSVFTGGRALSTSLGPAGGYLVTPEVMPAVEALKPWSFVARAGAFIPTNLTAPAIFPRVASHPSGAWLPNTVTASDGSLGSVSLVEKTYVGVVEFSMQLLRQGEQSEAVIRRMLLAAAGRILDGAALVGPGGVQPLGIMNLADIPSASGAAFAWATATGLLKTLADAGLDDSRAAFVASPSARKLLQERAKASGTSDFIWDDSDRIANRRAYCTPDMTGASMVVGDFSSLAIGLFGPGIRVDIQPHQNFNAGIGAARVVLSCDVAPLQAAAFVRVASVS